MEKTMTRKEIKQAKAVILRVKGADRIRFRKGEIHCYGQIPYTNQTGWYFCGWVRDLEVKGPSGIGIYY